MVAICGSRKQQLWGDVFACVRVRACARVHVCVTHFWGWSLGNCDTAASQPPAKEAPMKAPGVGPAFG